MLPTRAIVYHWPRKDDGILHRNSFLFLSMIVVAVDQLVLHYLT